MGYSALEKMRKINVEKYGIDGPVVPEMFTVSRAWEKDENGRKRKEKTSFPISNLEKHAVHFIRERCSDLRFSKEAKHQSLEDLDGTSLKKGQIPLNMEKDLDRRCLEVAVHRFLESGGSNDAFDVYFCYLEMFIGKYGETKKMIEMLSEFETNASSLLVKHRDHYSHSAYVFLIGLAFFDESDTFRQEYKKCYASLFEADKMDSDNDNDLAAHFLKYWGLASLFHDIGYPFELSFEQVKSYFGDSIDGVPFVQFKMNDYEVRNSKDNVAKLGKLLPNQNVNGNLNEYMAKALFNMLGNDYQVDNKDYEQYLLEVLNKKPSSPDEFGGYIDHAYFSTILLLDSLLSIMDEDSLNPMFTESLMAILLHNSLYKFSVTNVKKKDRNDGKHFTLSRSPLSYLLMLCDELQCWDRTSYGQQSRGEVHPYDCRFEFKNDKISVTYIFDTLYANDDCTGLNEHYEKKKGSYRKLGKDDTTESEFVKDIEEIISINGDTSFGETNKLELTATRAFAVNNRFRSAYLSSSNYIHLYKFAVMVHQMNHINEISEQEMYDKFNSMSLEYKINHLSRAKKYARMLNSIDCFYSDRPMDFEVVTSFGHELDDVLGASEHERWIWEHWVMGWRYGDTYRSIKAPEGVDGNFLRESTKTHIDMPVVADGNYTSEIGLKHYEDLTVEKGHSEDAKEKDIRSINNLLNVLNREDGIKIYRLK